MGSELAFEYLVGVLEAIKGLAVDTPTHYLNLAGTITPAQDRYRPSESRGMLAEYYRSAVVRQWSDWSGDGPADTYTLPFFLEQLIKGAGVITTPGGGATTRLHTYAPTMNADDLQSATLYWGDPNVQVFQSAYCMCDEITIAADASSSDGVTMSAKGMGWFPVKTAPDSVPAMLDAPLLAPSDMQLWIDTTLAIGTTEITDRLISEEFTIPSGIKRKWLASGPTGGQNFQAYGRAPRHAEAKAVFELSDMTQYDLWAAATSLKMRLRFNGPIIEGVLRHYINLDIYGPFDALDWGDLEGSNRTIGLSILSEYNAAAGYDFAVAVQNDRATI